MYCGLFLIVYEIGKPIITEKYCVNKNIFPDCEGSCHISKIIKEVEQNQESKNNLPTPQVEFKQISFINHSSTILSHPVEFVNGIYFGDFQEFYSYSISKSLFHPPNNLG